VLYLHITSRTPDEPERDLLQRTMGVRSWPSLAFLDSEGRRIARQRVRSVVGFAQTLGHLRQREMLARDASEDDVAARKLLVLDLLVLDALDFSEAAARFAALDGFAQSGRRAIESRLVELEVRHHASGPGSEDRMAVAEAMIAMLEGGRIPTAKSPAYMFWSSILFGAEQKDDVELYARGVAGMEHAFGDDEGMAAVLAGYRKKLEALR